MVYGGNGPIMDYVPPLAKKVFALEEDIVIILIHLMVEMIVYGMIIRLAVPTNLKESHVTRTSFAYQVNIFVIRVVVLFMETFII